MYFQANAAAVLQIELRNICLFAEALFGNVQHLRALHHLHRRNHVIPFAQFDRFYARRRSAHRAHVLLTEFDTHAETRCGKDFIVPFRCHNGNQVIVLPQVQRNQTHLTDVGKACHIGLFNQPLFGYHNKVLVCPEFLYGYCRRNFFAGANLQKVYDCHTARCASRFGNFISLHTVNLAMAGKEQHRIMCGGKEQILYIILLPRLHTDNAAPASVLALISIQRRTLYIIQI